ncbi:MAG: hypothetical protein LC672_03345, partial [Acidobacteria bacterium]|nr:hypothetical protein [Acidobacteriota bacterium]
MKYLRAALRVLALCLVTVGLYLFWLAGAPFVYHSADASRRWRNYNFRAWAAATVRIAGIRINLRGAPPQAPFFLVSNHLSYIDI